MTESANDEEKDQGPGELNLVESNSAESNWGPRLFLATAALVLFFFWWLLIFSGGVGGHHGFKMTEFVDEPEKTEAEVAD